MATESTDRARVVRFGTFEVDLNARELRKSGVRIKLHGQPFEVLSMLLQRPGEVVPREELRQKLWPTDTFVDFDHGVNTAINRLREALGDSAETPRFIETVPRRGYRFIGTVNGGAGNGVEPTALTEAQPDAGEKPARQLGIGARHAAVGLLDAGAPRWNKSRRKLWAAGLGLVGLCTLSAAGFYWFTNASSMRLPSVVHYRQLTADRQIKGESPCGADNEIVTDGPRVFFSEPSSDVAQVSSSGGDVVRVSTPFACFPFSDIFPRQDRIVGAISH